jgi:RNA polymerase sigma factor (sigma-70 family)
MPPTTLSGESRIRSTAGELHAGTLSCESLRHESDERLVALTRAGSERAFAEVTRRYQSALRAYCSRLVGPERAQDAVQQALLQAFLSLRDRAPREIVLRPWLYRIAHNCSIDLIRIGSWDHEQLDLESDGVPQPPALLEQKEELRGLIAGMRRLPDAQRQALTLRELEGCSYAEISARLGHTGSGVRQLIFRARTALRKGASALLPFGLLRDRLAGTVVEAHQVAGIAAVPASSAGATETLGAAALAMVVVLGGVAGGERNARATEAPAPALRSMAPLQSRTPVTASPAVRAPVAPRRSGRSKSDAVAPSPAPAPMIEQAVAPPAPMPAVSLEVVAPEAPAPSSDPGAQTPPAGPPIPDDEATGVQQQSLASRPGVPGSAPTQSPPDGFKSGSTTAPPASGPAPQAGPVKPRQPVSQKPPAVKRPPAKPRVPAAPGRGPAPAATPGRVQKSPVAPARPKKNGPAATRTAKTL